MKKIISTVLLFAITGLLQAQAPALFEKQELISGSDTLRYRILYPVNYRPEKKYPLIVFLHGSGERGNDNELQLKHGGKLFAREDIRNNHPAIVIFPQCPKDSAWSRFKRGQKMNEWIYDATLTATTPALLLLSELGVRVRFRINEIVGVFTLLVGILLIIRGLNLNIPFLSPYLLKGTSGTAIDCGS